MEITLRQLEGAFADQPVEVTSELDVFSRAGTKIRSFRYPVSNPEGTARLFWEHLAAHQDQGEYPCPDDDAELAAMAALLPALPLVAKLDPDARERVMDWARRRATNGEDR